MRAPRLLLVNKYAPPDESPTARLLGDLSAYCREAGWEVRFVSLREGYRRGRKRGLARWLGEMGTHVALLAKGLCAGRADVVLSLTDPPALLFTSWVMARLKRARLAHWVMDLYPDIAVALGEISASGRAARWVERVMRPAWRGAELVVALDEDMAERLRTRCGVVKCQTPWPPAMVEGNGFGEKPGESAAPLILYSGNLGRAHEYGTLLAAMAQLQEWGKPGQLVFQGGGPLYEVARREVEARGIDNIVFRDYVDVADLPGALCQARVLVVTQEPVTKGMLWPSKLALMEQSGCRLLFIGPPDGAIAGRVRAMGHGVFAPGEVLAVAEWLVEKLPMKGDCDLMRMRAGVARVREEGLRNMEEWLLCLLGDENQGK